ncbi:MAG: universal stress protein [Chloroflexota bacterium]
MIKSILVPLDGTFLAERAFKYALALARPFRANVLLYHSAPPSAQSRQPVDERAASSELDTLFAEAKGAGLTAERILDHADYAEDPAAAILDITRERHPDLIVMASHGRSGLKDGVLGSASERVVRDAPCAVLVVPSAPDEAWTSAEGLRILVPIENFEIAEPALRGAEELAGALGGTILLTHFVDPAETSPDRAPIDVADTLSVVDRLTVEMRRKGLAAEPRAKLGEPSVMILTAATDWNADVIVMATHGRRGFERLTLGSVTEAVVRSAPVPTLVVRRGSRGNLA